ncbi:gamma-glutamylcyclotransferase family protein [Streptomyces sp. NPDC056470]|uniref:gamma-glutamylcyclotransferase family protein n=1 Tax=Streptomyces sp. NPDC056470 TaxID=3345831 RepID=UPI00367A2DAA
MNPERTIERRTAMRLGGAIALGGTGAVAGAVSPASRPAANPAPSPSGAERTYLFGYGSLIQRESRTATWPGAREAVPVTVRGVSRGWYDRVETVSWGPTYLRAVPGKGATCNGVLFPVTRKELADYTRRESGYRPTRIPTRDISVLDGSTAPPVGVVWYFANVVRRRPDELFPIVQSYVDVCLDGCLEIEESPPEAREARFAEEFIRTTSGWRTPWFNDRIHPWRPFVHVPRANAIDTLLRDGLGQGLFDEITLPRRPARPAWLPRVPGCAGCVAPG